MALGLPVVDTFQVVKTVIKFTLFVSFVTLFGSLVPQVSTLLKSAMDKAMNGLGIINGLDLHCVAGLIGLDAFLNSLFNMIFIAGTFYISGIATILTVKYTLLLFGYMMRI